MKRNCSLDEISDGKLYNANDLVEVSCNGCKGCAPCCHGMGKSIILDPFDIYRLTTNLDCSFQELLMDKIELNVVDGIILPNLKMTGQFERCAFLNQEGRCSIHTYRPGICRIFPLGRIYENYTFQYFLQTNECQNTAKTKRKISKWIDTPDLEKNEKYLTDWHYFLVDLEKKVKVIQGDNYIKEINMKLLNLFYIQKYNKDNFYTQFYQRLEEAKNM